MTSREKNKTMLIFILGLLSAIGPFSIDMYLPGFPSIAKDLHTTVSRISLSLSSFFIGISFGQLFYGPIVDRFGRKAPLYGGLLVYFMSSVACAFAKSVDQLILLRFIQAMGGCAGMVVSRTMVRDLFHVKDNARVFSLLMLVVGVSPIIAPTLGGYIAAFLGWRYIFIALSLIAAAILVAVHLRLPESRKPDKAFSLLPQHIVSSYIQVIGEPQFHTYALTGSLASAGLYAYIAGSPYVFMEWFKVSEKLYGWIFAFIACGLIGASQINTLLLRRYTSEQVIKIALLCQSLTGILFFTGMFLGWLGLTGTILLSFIFLSCQGCTFPNSSALSLAPFSKKAGTASALMGAIQMGIGSMTSALVGFLGTHSAVPMTGVMACCSMTSFAILLIGSRRIRYRAAIMEVKEQSAEMISTS